MPFAPLESNLFQPNKAGLLPTALQARRARLAGRTARVLRQGEPAATIAAGSDCEDDLTFLNRAFAILVEHPSNAGAQRDLLQRMRNGDSRQHIISRIVSRTTSAIV